ncbi:ribosomal protein L15 [Fistulina hepatica ATCC 64428]|uniref:Ribosomal protein L15 n=1 Tax=Fistulina hepatica ATCC 64428 TaxID=1128425 RepID=A0A0D7A433_9AGAR|nr:ribosomal protein L15 [Fistulina hepatica ATCC 64428]
MSSSSRVARTTLGNLRAARGSQHNQKRVGRGQGSGYGGTSGRGMNGQKSRSGVGLKPQFEGGQTTIVKRFPKRGFYNPNAKTWAPVNLDRIQHWIDIGRLTSSPEHPITARELLLSGCVHDVHDGIKVLGDGAPHLKTPVYITPSRASKSAIRAVEANGGKIVCKYYNALALRDCVHGRMDRVEAAPTRKADIKWYGKDQNRGYISKETLVRLGELSFVQERWRLLADQLGNWMEKGVEKEKLKK